MHEKSVIEFFEVHGNMAIKLEGLDHDWPRRAAITVDELRDGIISKMRDQQNYFKEYFVKKMIKEVLEEDLDNLIDKIADRIEQRNEGVLKEVLEKVNAKKS